MPKGETADFPLMGRDADGFVWARPIARRAVEEQRISPYHVLNRFVAVKNYGHAQGFLLDHGSLSGDIGFLLARFERWTRGEPGETSSPELEWSEGSSCLIRPGTYATKYGIDRTGKRPRLTCETEAVPIDTLLNGLATCEEYDDLTLPEAPAPKASAQGRVLVEAMMRRAFAPVSQELGQEVVPSASTYEDAMQPLPEPFGSDGVQRCSYEGLEWVLAHGENDLKRADIVSVVESLQNELMGNLRFLDCLMETCEAMSYVDFVSYRDFFRDMLALLVAAGRKDPAGANFLRSRFESFEHEGHWYVSFRCAGFGPYGFFEPFFAENHLFANHAQLGPIEGDLCGAAFRTHYRDECWRRRNALVFPLRGVHARPSDDEMLGVVEDVATKSFLFLLSLYTGGKTDLPVDAGRLRANRKLHDPSELPLAALFFETLAWVFESGQTVVMCSHCGSVPIIRGTTKSTCSGSCRTQKSAG